MMRILILPRKRGGTLEKTEWKLGLTTSRGKGSMELKDQVGREEKKREGSVRGKGKVDGRIWFIMKNRKRKQSIIAASSRCEWKISAAKKKIYFLLFVSSCPSDLYAKKETVIAALQRSWTFLPSFLQSNASLHPLSHICFSLVTLSLFWLCSRVIRIIMIKLVVGFFTV